MSFKLRSGATRVGTLIQAAGAPFPPRNAPLVVWQQGGPGVSMLNVWLRYLTDTPVHVSSATRIK